MTKITKICLLGGLLLSAALPAAAEVSADQVIASVNGEEITLGQMIAVREGLQPPLTDMPAQELYDTILDQMIRQAALAQVGEDEKSRRDDAALVLDRRAYLAGAVLERAAGGEVPEEELRALYEQEFASAEPPTEYSAAHILVDTEAEAQAIKDELDAGADFAELAREKSTGPSGPNGGDLGWFTLEMMVEPFSEAVAGLEPGGVSGPVETQFGWHIVRLNETRNAAVQSFEELRAQLEQKVRADKMQARMDQIMEGAAVERSTEAIDPAILTQTDLIDE